MLGILIDAVVLIVLLKTIVDEDVGLLKACLISVVASIVTSVLASVLFAAIGIAGVALGALIGAALLGVAVSAMVGAEIKRAMAIGGIFTLVHIFVAAGFYFLWS
jgi:hypothetical protein